MALRTRFWMKKNEVEKKKKYNLAFSGHSDSVIYMYGKQREVIKGKAHYGMV